MGFPMWYTCIYWSQLFKKKKKYDNPTAATLAKLPPGLLLPTLRAEPSSELFWSHDSSGNQGVGTRKQWASHGKAEAQASFVIMSSG